MKPPEPEIANALLILLRQGTRHPHVIMGRPPNQPPRVRPSVRVLIRLLDCPLNSLPSVRSPSARTSDRNSARRIAAAHLPHSCRLLTQLLVRLPACLLSVRLPTARPLARLLCRRATAVRDPYWGRRSALATSRWSYR
jgi:hypothetical protein